jgi:hypothetical protein
MHALYYNDLSSSGADNLTVPVPVRNFTYSSFVRPQQTVVYSYPSIYVQGGVMNCGLLFAGPPLPPLGGP